MSSDSSTICSVRPLPEMSSCVSDFYSSNIGRWQKYVTYRTSRIFFARLTRTKEKWKRKQTDFFYWHDVVDKFDSILARACRPFQGNPFYLHCDSPSEHVVKKQNASNRNA